MIKIDVISTHTRSQIGVQNQTPDGLKNDKSADSLGRKI